MVLWVRFRPKNHLWSGGRTWWYWAIGETTPTKGSVSPRVAGQCYSRGMSNGEKWSPCCGLSLCRRFFTRICGLSRQSRRLSLPHIGGLSRFFRKRGSSAHQFGLSLCCWFFHAQFFQQITAKQTGNNTRKNGYKRNWMVQIVYNQLFYPLKQP